MRYSNAVRVLLNKSKNNYESAQSDFLARRFDTCVSGLYYSCFQSVVALMILRGQAETKHTHVRAFVNKELARRGIIEKRLVKFYNKLMEDRSDADYSPSIIFEENAVRTLKDLTIEFNQVILKIIESESAEES
ncbi:HEPN domain-containing protein [Paenibacillus sp. HB172176]|uniref:HEPN domain-containing protein n=1 Tax=Paenibacillus sp. HB172176 TaxID=2493690 RepID=UPI00198169B8|nr:HEPN domain-containing protein [Paenibacillus sp. HB172176]